MISNFEHAKKSELDIVKNIFVDRLMPFHEMTEHVKMLEKYMLKVGIVLKFILECIYVAINILNSDLVFGISSYTRYEIIDMLIVSIRCQCMK